MNRKEKKILLLLFVFLIFTVSLIFYTGFFRAFEGPKEFCLALFTTLLSLFCIYGHLKYGFTPARGKLTIPLLIFGALALISWAVNPTKPAGMPFIINLIYSMLIFFIVITLGDHELAEKLKPYLIGVGAVTAIYSLMQHGNIDPVKWAQEELVKSRSISTLGNPDFLSSFLVMLIPVSLTDGLRESKGRASLVSLLTFGLLCMVNIYTYSRTGLISMVIPVIITLIFIGSAILRKSRKLLAAALILFLLAFGAIGLLEKSGKTAHTLTQRTEAFINLSENNVATRIGLWKAALIITAEHPLLGTGPGNFNTAYLPLRHLEPMIVRNRVALPGSPHNLLLEISSFYGVPALVAYCVFVAVLIYLAWRFFFGENQTADDDKRLLYSGYAGGIAAFYIHHLAVFSTIPTDMLFYLFCGLFWIGAAGPAEKKSPENPEKPFRPTGSQLLIISAFGLVLLSLLYITGHRTMGDYMAGQAEKYREAMRYVSDKSLKDEGFKKSFHYFKNALKLDPTNYEYWLRLGKLTEEYALSSDNPQQAGQLLMGSEKAYLQAIRLNPDNPYAYADMGRMLFRLGMTEQALSFSSKAVALDPYNPILVSDLAVRYDSAGNHSEAEKYFLRAIELYPIGHGGYGNLGLFYYKRKEYEKSRESFLKALERAPEDIGYRGYLDKIKDAMKEKNRPDKN